VHRVLFLLKRAHISVRQAMDTALAEYGLTASQLEVLGPVVKSDGLEHRSLLQWMEVSSPTLTNLVDNLVERGYIERRISSQDARVKLLYPTERGRELWSKLEETQDAFFQQMLKGLSRGEITLMEELLERITHNACGEDCNH
jgi:MarR family transcriptional regulator, transcriptional regulator for hemolysin